jgi:hypothetical protein
MLVAGCATRPNVYDQVYAGIQARKAQIDAMPPGPEKDAARRQFLADLSQTQATLRADLEYKARMQMYQAQTQAARAYQNPPPPGYHYEAGGTLLVRDPPTQVEIVNPYGF